MVKNTTGGSHFKKMSRKQNASSFNYDSLNDPNIINVSVMKALGNCRFLVSTNKGDELTMHIPGRFSGRNKHRNFVTVNCMVKVQLREFEHPTKNCDYLQMIQSTTPASFFLNPQMHPRYLLEDSLDDRIVFKNVEDEETLPSTVLKPISEDPHELETLENINFDDI